MPRTPFNELAAFAMVAQERSFTAASVRLEVSPSALSHAMRGLEARLGVRLLARTTRSVSATEAGERLLATLRPAFAEIEGGVAALRDARETPIGTVRVTAVKHAVETLVMPKLAAFTARYPDIQLEIDVDDGMVDIVASGYDLGIRFSGSVEKDMIAVDLGPDLQTLVVAAPCYVEGRSEPIRPRDLSEHRCIGHRRVDGSTYPWPLKVSGRVQQIRPAFAIAFNDSELVLDAALGGQGIACVFADRAAPHIENGSLVALTIPSDVTIPGYALYYASRRQMPPALACFVEAMRKT